MAIKRRPILIIGLAALVCAVVVFLSTILWPHIVEFGSGNSGPFGEFPENPGYVRATDWESGKLVIFDADTFEIYRTVDLPHASIDGAHRLERGDKGKIWMGHNGIDRFGLSLPWDPRPGVMIFSAEGELEHALEVNDDTGCRLPVGGIAFANGYAFVGCSGSSAAELLVVNTETMEVVKTLEIERPDPEIPGWSDFYIVSVEEVAGSVLAFGKGGPPMDYDRVTLSRSGVAIVARIDADTMTVHDYKAEFAPGSKILDAVEVDGMAWLLNSWSHIPERPPRTDIYVMDPVTIEIVDSFNLPKPYPVWGKIGADGYVYIYHKGDFDTGEWGGVTRIDPVTRETEYTKINDPERGFSAQGFGVYRDQPCVVLRSGLWCMNDDGTLDQKVSQKHSAGVLFAPSMEE